MNIGISKRGLCFILAIEFAGDVGFSLRENNWPLLAMQAVSSLMFAWYFIVGDGNAFLDSK